MEVQSIQPVDMTVLNAAETRALAAFSYLGFRCETLRGTALVVHERNSLGFIEVGGKVTVGLTVGDVAHVPRDSWADSDTYAHELAHLLERGESHPCTSEEETASSVTGPGHCSWSRRGVWRAILAAN
jgi:hypothetical protein